MILDVVVGGRDMMPTGPAIRTFHSVPVAAVVFPVRGFRSYMRGQHLSLTSEAPNRGPHCGSGPFPSWGESGDHAQITGPTHAIN